ncbi:RCC1/BLIP-II [Microthyrium microscopicum]|uniref:RCC1/BLIP-II n=1 Tax=Microthyrium microscopicum TaxID=703497 RepID=A0A6A6UNH4_9PEZI|nr:RCC1/BLIP-II [Microthyrium microscopicum]
MKPKTKPPRILNKLPTEVYKLLVCGTGESGELGLGPNESKIITRPREIPTTGIIHLSSGPVHTTVVTQNGQIMNWGINDDSALGRNTSFSPSLSESTESDATDSLNPHESVPTLIPDASFPQNTIFVQSTSGQSCTFALTTTGLVYGWGTFHDNAGTLSFTIDADDKVVTKAQRPILIQHLKNIVSISAGNNFCLALDEKGAVFGWGIGQQSQLGKRLIGRRVEQSLIPSRIPLPPSKKMRSIHTTSNTAFAIDRDGSIWAWGLNNTCQTGIAPGTGEHEVVAPTKVSALANLNIVSIAGGANHTIGMTRAGEAYVWGAFAHGQTGLEASSLLQEDSQAIGRNEDGKPTYHTPKKLDLAGVIGVAAGSNHTMAFTQDGRLYTWGLNDSRQCGLGPLASNRIDRPTRIANTAVSSLEVVAGSAGASILLILLTTLIILTTRLLLILPPYRGPPLPRKRGSPTHLLVVLGSGGHTAEMLTMLGGLDTKAYTHRTYIVSAGDPISATKAAAFETTLVQRALQSNPKASAGELRALQGTYTIATVPRARKVHQSFLTAPYTCLLTLLATLRLLHAPPLVEPGKQGSAPGAPDLILTNGPATSAIVVYASLLLRFLGARGHVDTRIIYVESFARIESLSLTARCLGWAVDRLIVQWGELAGKMGGKAEYGGLLVMAALERGKSEKSRKFGNNEKDMSNTS